MSTIDLEPGEYRRVGKKRREPILAPYWWVGVIHLVGLYAFSAVGHWLLDRLL